MLKELYPRRRVYVEIPKPTRVGKTGILSITFATREQYSQKLRDIYVTISDEQKLSTL
jgi:hypothetical protein